MGRGRFLVDETAIAAASNPGLLRRHIALLPRPLRFLCVGTAGLITDLSVFTAIPLHATYPLAARLVSMAAATLVTWRLNRELTFDATGRRQHEEALRYAAVTTLSQGASFIVFSALVVTALRQVPQLALLAGAAAGAGIAYSGHLLFAFRPRTRAGGGEP
jgi:putative flippase GtrA